MTTGRETIDRMRDRAPGYAQEALLLRPGISLGDVAFYVHCRLTSDKYLDRQGMKAEATAERDAECARWYRAMADHVVGLGPDPRCHRPGFVTYEPHEPTDG